MIKEGQEVFLRKVAKESMRNAEQFIDDAEALLRKKSYGHAFALAVLGEEEMAKGIMYSNAVDEGLQRERENAMYVEADLKEQRISSPRRFRKSKAERYISDVKDRLEILKHEVGKRKSVADREVGREIIRMMLSKSEGEQKKKLLEWYGITEKELES